MAMQPAQAHTTSKRTSCYLGVTWHKQQQLWQTSITIKHRLLYLGFFADEQVAARAYDQAVRQYKGPGSPINFP